MAVTGGSGVVIGNYPQYVDAARKLAKAVSSFGTVANLLNVVSAGCVKGFV
jgi:hypothetical protein